MADTISCECIPLSGDKGFRAESGWYITAEPTLKWIRVKTGSHYVADSKRALLVRESGRLPVYYFPKEDVDWSLLEGEDKKVYKEHKGSATLYNIVDGERIVKKAAWGYDQPEDDSEVLKGYIAFDWNSVDHWYEEEEEVFKHARDPYSRIDTILSSRHIQVILNGKVVADSKRPYILYETGLTPRYYLPKEDLNWDYLKPTDTKTVCPYKGEASYWDAYVEGKDYKDILWSYQDPVPEIPKIKGLYSFYNEKVDELLVDGQPWKLHSKDNIPSAKILKEFV